MANDKNFKIKNGLSIGGDPSAVVDAATYYSSDTNYVVDGIGSALFDRPRYNPITGALTYFGVNASSKIATTGNATDIANPSATPPTLRVGANDDYIYTPNLDGSYTSIYCSDGKSLSCRPTCTDTTGKILCTGFGFTSDFEPETTTSFLGTGSGFLYGGTFGARTGYQALGVNFSSLIGVSSTTFIRNGNATTMAPYITTISTQYVGDATYGPAGSSSTFTTIAAYLANNTRLGSAAGASVTLDSYAALHATYPTLYTTNLTINDDIYGIYISGSGFTNRFGGDTQLFPDITTTASAANVYMDTADNNRLYVSTSSIEYKTDVENLDPTYADNILNLRPVWYRSTASADPADWSYYGLIAEEVAAVEPRLVHYGYKQSDYEEVIVTEEVRIDENSPEYDEANPDKTETVERTERRLKDGAVKAPNGVAYERLSVMLLDIIKRQSQQIEALEARVAALETA